jgi:hypothetical protein
MDTCNLENEDGPIYRLVFQTHDEALKLVEKDDPGQSKAEGFPTSKRQMRGRGISSLFISLEPPTDFAAGL